MTGRQLQAIRDRLAAAPAGWTYRIDAGDGVSLTGPDGYPVLVFQRIRGIDEANAAAAFLAASPVDVRALLATVDELIRDLHDLSQDKGAILAAARRQGREEFREAVTAFTNVYEDDLRTAERTLPVADAPQTYLDLLEENALRSAALKAAVAWMEERRVVGDAMPPWWLAAKLALGD
jgi:hypothetical protein